MVESRNGSLDSLFSQLGKLLPFVFTFSTAVAGYVKLSSDLTYLTQTVKDEQVARKELEFKFEQYVVSADERLEDKMRPIRRTLKSVELNIMSVCQATPGARCERPQSGD